MIMINDSDKYSQGMKWLENVFDLDDRSLKYLFWFFSVLTIPVFAYLYTLPLTLLMWLMTELFGLGEKAIDIITKFGVGICLVAAFITQFQLRKMYKNKKSTN